MSVQRSSNKQRASDRLQKPVVRRRDPALEEAIANDRIAIHFQPQIEPATGRIVGVEALARWDDEQSASGLFERARRGGLKERLSRFAQRKALRIAGAWTGQLADLKISINLLAEDLVRDGYDRWLLGEIANADLAPERVTIEITEDSLLDARRHNYLGGLAEAAGELGLAWLDLSTGEFFLQPVARTAK